MNERKRDPDLIKQLLGEIDPLTRKRTQTRMAIAAVLGDYMEELDMSVYTLMAQTCKTEDTVRGWLSGTHDFTVSELVLFENVFNIDVFGHVIRVYRDKE